MTENNSAENVTFLKSLNPLNVLLEEMKQPSVKKRAQTIKTFTTISIALGPEKTRVFLIPFINQLFKDEEEIQRELIKLIPQLINYIGGQYHAHLLMDIIFNQLQKQEEVQIRDELLICIKQIFKQINLKHFEKILMDFTNRTLQNDNFRQKEISIILMPEFFTELDEENQKEIIENIEKLSTDPTPMIRKIICQSLVFFGKIIPIFPENTFIQIFENFLQDESDFVRVPLLEILIILKQKIQSKTQEELNNIFIEKILQDKSIKIKCNLIEQIELIVNSFEKNIINQFYIPSLLEFLGENADNEVKIKFLQNILNIYQFIPNFSQLFIPKLKLLIKEKGIQIKNNLGDAIINLLQEGNIDLLKILESFFEELLEESDNEQKFKLFKKIKDFKKFQQNLSSNVIQTIIKSIENISQSKKWRVRTSALNTISRLVHEANLQQNQVDKTFFQIIKNLLKDNTAEVRLESAKTLGLLAKNFPPEFTQNFILPEFYELFENNNYLLRIGAFFSIKYTIQSLSQSYIFTQIKDLLEKGAIDKVPNIKIVVLEIIEEIIKHFGANNTDNIYQILNNLAKDKDNQVKQKAIYILKQQQ
ncbi:protein phosphatase pp2a regulatory subunit a, putative [Ichthyophthirius multifiliis]|uniref:Protein phosphatase pp2a regulatory subunit a, putative n=1 Tax=Ichthyophthirius multifiliis TaxID=5932 RepID=G0R5P9_ICHMU|nr:protein phosphatase pp2a regulatory subunit a, putative [Ichthyophthirius multifiliis]EGR27222.1 protein phosphatase pp2a regulatory subunit a, putative [Ichthyophthirius multifiliis]|eukprot:XP_004024106.1 protein phosphatase pp2a regulatory subunit a, putative [Ichthyophthirius multifiliis]